MNRSYYINNPSAWSEGFDQTISDELERITNERDTLNSLIEGLKEEFPGLVDGETEVNGSYLIEYLTHALKG